MFAHGMVWVILSYFDLCKFASPTGKILRYHWRGLNNHRLREFLTILLLQELRNRTRLSPGFWKGGWFPSHQAFKKGLILFFLNIADFHSWFQRSFKTERRICMVNFKILFTKKDPVWQHLHHVHRVFIVHHFKCARLYGLRGNKKCSPRLSFSMKIQRK
jgi:hypothetical protein